MIERGAWGGGGGGDRSMSEYLPSLSVLYMRAPPLYMVITHI